MEATKRQKEYRMKRKTSELLERLNKTQLFNAVGTPVPESMQGMVIQLKSWKEALRCCCSMEWDNYTLEHRNLLTMYLHTHAPERDKDWNDVTKDVDAVAEPLVHEKVRSLGNLSESQQKEVYNCVRWAVLAACMELEYADIRQPAFFSWLMEFYLLGRYPCGWGDKSIFGRIRLYGPVDDTDYDPNETCPQKLVLAEHNRVYASEVRMPTSGKLLIY